MKHEHVIGGLIDKRRELMARVDQAQTLLRQLVMDLDALDATIRIFKPDIKLDRIRPKAPPIKHAATKGETMDAIFSTLRDAREPVSTLQLTLHVMAARGLDTADAKFVRTMRKRVGSALRHFRRKKLVEATPGPDRFNLWRVAARPNSLILSST